MKLRARTVSLPILLSLAGMAAVVAGVWVLLGLGAGLVATGVAAFVLEWRLSE